MNPIFKCNRRTRVGTYTVLLSLVLLVSLVVLNLLVAMIPRKYTLLDATNNDLFTISEASEKFLKQVDAPVTLYFLCENGETEERVYTFLRRYTALNSHITLEVVDPLVNPALVSEYSADELNNFSIIVKSEKRAIAIDYYDFYFFYNEVYGKMTPAEYYSYTQSSAYAYYESTYPTSEYFDGDAKVTNGISYALTDKLPKLYLLTGHGETALGTELLSELAANQFTAVSDFSLLTGNIPEDCDLLLINAPKKDISIDEATVLRDYLEKGGKLFLTTNADGIYNSYEKTDDSGEKEEIESNFPNLLSLLSQYGLSAENGYVVETDKNHYYNAGYTSIPLALFPDVSSDHAIASEMEKNTFSLFYGAHPIKVDKASGASSLFTSTTGSYTVPADSESLTRREDSLSGPFTVGATYENDSDTRIVWLSSGRFLDDSINTTVLGGNYAYTLALLRWSCGKTEISIPSVSLKEPMLTVTNTTVTFYATIFCILIPVGILLGGLFYWLRRRRH